MDETPIINRVEAKKVRVKIKNTSEHLFFFLIQNQVMEQKVYKNDRDLFFDKIADSDLYHCGIPDVPNTFG